MKRGIIAIALICCSQAFAQIAPQESVVLVDADKKVIQVDKLNLPASTPVKDILALLPELVNRKAEYIAASYDVKINDISVGDARDAVLSQIQIAEIKCVEVSENSLNSVTSFGQGGSINIILKDTKEGTSGSAMLDVAYVPDLVSGLLLNHKTKKWTVRAFGNIEHYKPEGLKTETIDVNFNRSSTCSNQLFFSETARIDATYQATERDMLKFNVAEIYINDRETDTSVIEKADLHDEQNTQDKHTNLDAETEYSHLFANKSKLTAAAKYTFSPQCTKKTYKMSLAQEDNDYYLDYDIFAHNLYGKLEYLLPLIKSDNDRRLDLETGIHSAYRKAKNDAFREYSFIDSKIDLKTNEYNYFLRPFIKFTGKYKAFSFLGSADFQHYHYKITNIGSNDYNTKQNDVTGTLSALWQANDRNLFRLSYYHSIIRPSGMELFPYIVDNPSTGYLNKGNPHLKPTKTDNVDLDYMLNLSNDQRTLTFNFGVDYTFGHDIIEPLYVAEEEPYYTYHNTGKYNIVRGDMMAYYSRGIFSLSLTTNVFYGYNGEESDKDHFTHFNISLTPSLNFNDGWACSAGIYYNSKFMTDFYELGDLCYANLLLGKYWKHWNAHLYSLVKLNDWASDTFYNSGGGSAIKNYEYMKCEVGIGVRYHF